MIGKKREDRPQKVKIKKKFNAAEMFNNEDYGNGLRCVIICALAIVLVVGINWMMSCLPTTISNINIAISKVYSIASDTEETIKALDQEVNVYLVCEEGEEDSNTITVLGLYDDLSDNLIVSQVDPAFDEEFIQKYTGVETVTNNTIIVVSGDKQQVMAYSDYCSSSTFVLEDYLNSAITYVTSDSLSKVYALTGHGESSFTDDMISYMGLDGFEAEEISLIETGKIPEDAQCVIINGLTEDITENEADILLEYLENGGRLLLCTGYTNSSFPNLETVTDYFGASLEKGYVVEGDDSHYVESNPTYLLPYIITDGNPILSEGVAYVMIPSAKGIVLNDNIRDTVDVAVILQTSSSAYAVYSNIFTNSTETFTGPFYLGVTFSEETENGEAKMVWFSTAYITNSSIDSYVGGGNITMFLNAVCWLSEDEPVASVHGKTVANQYLTVSSSALKVWRNIMLIGLPLLIILAGAVICIRRRRR